VIRDTGKYPKKGRKGMVLILTFIIMTTLTAIVVSFIYLTSVQSKGSGYDVVSRKAFWLAEAGIQKVIYKLKMEPAFVGGTFPTTVSGSLGGGTYSVLVNKNGTTYTLTSTGTMSGINKIIQQSVFLTTAPVQGTYSLTPGSVTNGKDWNETY